MTRKDTDLREKLERMVAVLRDLEAFHRRRDFHGGVCPDAVRLGRWRARLDPPCRAEAPVEYRDPERERARIKDPRENDRAGARADVFGAGALLYEWIEGGPPLCGPVSPFTRPVPPAAAWIASRAMAEGPARYPTAREMRRDLEHLLALSRRKPIDAVQPKELPSYVGRRLTAPPPLRVFKVRRRRRRFGHLIAAGALVACLLFLTAGGGSDGAPAPAAAEASSETGLRGLVAQWRSRLDGGLRAAGEELDPEKVPLLVVSDVGDPGDLGWPRHPSTTLAGALRATVRDEADPAEVQRVLTTLLGEKTLPVVLQLSHGQVPGQVDARLYYRGILLTGSSGL